MFYPDPQALGGIQTAGGSTTDGARSSRRRRRDRDAEGVEGVGNGEGVSPPQPTRGSGGASLQHNMIKNFNKNRA